jgi:hypothetical protein
MTREQHDNLFRLARELFGALKDYDVAPEFLATPAVLQHFAYRPENSGWPERLFITWDGGTVLQLAPPPKETT